MIKGHTCMLLYNTQGLALWMFIMIGSLIIMMEKINDIAHNLPISSGNFRMATSFKIRCVKFFNCVSPSGNLPNNKYDPPISFRMINLPDKKTNCTTMTNTILINICRKTIWLWKIWHMPGTFHIKIIVRIVILMIRKVQTELICTLDFWISNEPNQAKKNECLNQINPLLKVRKTCNDHRLILLFQRITAEINNLKTFTFADIFWNDHQLYKKIKTTDLLWSRLVTLYLFLLFNWGKCTPSRSLKTWTAFSRLAGTATTCINIS